VPSAYYSYIADLVVIGHAAYVSYVVFGQVAILAGLLLRRRWAGNPWFRWTHLVMISIVALEALWDIACPLTTWEDSLRGMAGQAVQDGTFMGRLVHHLIFYAAPPWAFTTVYVGFALLVLLTFVLAPPRPLRGIFQLRRLKSETVA
jgi:Protein of Unknown function (DUF2784)